MFALSKMASLLPTPTFRLEVRGADGNVCANLAVDETATFSLKEGRNVYSATYADGPRLPRAFHATLYCRKGPLPEAEVASFPAKIAVDTIPSGELFIIQKGSDVTTSSAKYESLAKTVWAQLNPTEAQYTLQLKLKKVAPDMKSRDPKTGDYYIYAAERCIVYVAPPPMSDRDKVLDV